MGCAEVDCLLGGDSLLGITLMDECFMGHGVVYTSTDVGSYDIACVVG